MNTIATASHEAVAPCININPLKFNPYAPDFLANPYETYRRMQDEYPLYLYRVGAITEWWVTRHEDIKQILGSSQFIVENLPERVPQPSRHLISNRQQLDALKASLAPWLFSLDPPHHSRIRQLVSRDFTHKALQELTPFIKGIVANKFDQLERLGEIDFVTEIAKPLPLLATGKLLGLPIDDLSRFLSCAENLFRVFERPITFKEFDRMVESAAFFEEKIRNEMMLREKYMPKNDLFGRLLAQDDAKLSETEFLSFVAMLFSVGQDSTENYIANSIAALLTHDSEYSLLLEDHSLIDNAVLELARFDSSIQVISRVVNATVTMHGFTMQPGDRLYISLGAANRDPRQFENPGQLDLRRQSQNNFPFGSGIHFCLGSALAKLQLTCVLEELIKRPKLCWDTNKIAERRRTAVVRGYRSLPIKFA